MGKGSNWRIVHPEMGARRLTLNHGLHEPGQEFTQHLHDESEDMIVVLEGGGSLRQGDTYTPIVAGEGIFVPVGEVHGTVNDSGAPARLISFQAPPDPALYAGKRDHGAGAFPLPPADHRSEVRVFSLAKGGPALGQPGDWRCVVSAGQGARHLGLDYITPVRRGRICPTRRPPPKRYSCCLPVPPSSRPTATGTRCRATAWYSCSTATSSC